MSKGSGIGLLVVGIILSIFAGMMVCVGIVFSMYYGLLGSLILFIFLLGLGIVLIVVGISLIKGSKRAGERPEKV